jgi:hypothetical protein
VEADTDYHRGEFRGVGKVKGATSGAFCPVKKTAITTPYVICSRSQSKKDGKKTVAYIQKETRKICGSLLISSI